MDRKRMFAELRKRGAAKAVVEFGGGGDDGGVENIQLLSETGFPICTLEPWGGEGVEKELAAALSKPVYDKYYSFAGEFYVNGTIEYDVEKETVIMSGKESEEVWNDFEETL
jgi:hypothetical protein